MISYGGASGDVLSVHSLVRYTMRRDDPAQSETQALREELRRSAGQVPSGVLLDVSDIRNLTRLAMEVAHAKYLVPEPSMVDEALLTERLASFEGERGNYRLALAIERKVLLVMKRVLGHP